MFAHLDELVSLVNRLVGAAERIADSLEKRAVTDEELREMRIEFAQAIAHDENLAAWARQYGPTLLTAVAP